MCNDGVIEAIQESIDVIPSTNPVVTIILQIVSEILTEICGSQGAELGFPEIYPVLPGAQRPAIVFYYKEFIEGVKQKSTFTSTVNNPSASAIAAIGSVIVPNKTMGTVVVALKLNDGSRISTTGETESGAISNYNFLLSQVDPAIIPANESTLRTVTIRETLAVREVVCVQIENYPEGRAAGVSPSVRRIIPVE